MPYVATPRFADWYDDIVSGIQQAIPSNTVVGKAVAGDWAGATAGAIKYATATATSPSGRTPTIQPTSGGLHSPGLFDPGGFVAQNQTVLLLAAAGLTVFLVTRRGGKRR